VKRRLLLALAACAALIAVCAGPVGRASSAVEAGAPTFMHTPLIAGTAPPAPAQAVSPPGSQRLFLPAIQLPERPPTSVRFGAGLVDGALTGEAEAFAYGITALFYQVEVAGAAGRPFREEWLVDGVRRPELDRAGTLPPDSFSYASGITLSTGAPLPRGVYELRLFVDGILSGSGLATIR
jgi:hypothetical protein